MSLNLQPFLAAMTAGQQINVDMDAKRASTAAQLQTTAFNQQKMDSSVAAQAQAQASAKQMQDIINQSEQVRQQRQVETGQSPDIQAEQEIQGTSDTYRKLAAAAAGSGDSDTATKYFKLADEQAGKIGPLRTQNLEIAAKKSAKVASFAGAVLDGSADPKTAFEFVKENEGLPAAMQMPTNPTSPEYANFWKTRRTQGMTAEQQFTNQRAIEQDKATAEKNKQEHDDKVADRLQRSQDRAADREIRTSERATAAEAAADAKANKASSADIRNTEGLNKRLATAVKPLLEDRERLNTIDGLLQVNSSAADQQMHQSLTALMGNFKGRATNLFYKDNKNFGDVSNRLNGILSHAFTGRYSEADRLAIGNLVTQMRDRTIDPALSAAETRMKEHGKGYGLDPDQIEINADFGRGDGSGKPAAAPRTDYGEGQIAVNKQTGQTLVFTNGKWVPK